MVTLRQLRYLEALADTLHSATRPRPCRHPASTQHADQGTRRRAPSQPHRAPKVGHRNDRSGRRDRQARAHNTRLGARPPRLRQASRNVLQRIAGEALGAIPSIAPYLLPVALPELQRRFPDLNLAPPRNHHRNLDTGAGSAATSISFSLPFRSRTQIETLHLLDDNSCSRRVAQRQAP